MRNGFIAVVALLGAAALVEPSQPPLPPEISIDVAPKVPPVAEEGLAATSDRDLPPVVPPATVWPPDVVDARPGFVAMVRIPHPQRPRGDFQTKMVEMARIEGHADSCRCTTCNSPAGSQWVGVDGLSYIKQEDGTFSERGDEPLLAMARPAGNWGTVSAANT